MRLEDRQWAGLFLFVGATQFTIGMIIAESVDPSYSVSANYISDLGVRAGAAVFNSSVFILGATIVATSWFASRALKDRILMVAMLLTGVEGDRKSTRLNSSHSSISYAVFCLKKKKPRD